MREFPRCFVETFHETSLLLTPSDRGERMYTVSRNELDGRRRERRRLNNGNRLHDDNDAAQYVNERGFVLLAPDPSLPLPSISEADEREPWSNYTVTDGAWTWKETLPARGHCAYGKFVRNRGAFISWEYFPFFYAARGVHSDWEKAYRDGYIDRLTAELMGTLTELAPVDSRELWKAVRWRFSGNRSRFTRCLENLQSRYFIMVVGGSTEGWSLHQWGLVKDAAPAGCLDGLPDAEEAAAILLRQFIRNCVCCTARQAASALKLTLPAVQAAASDLEQRGVVLRVSAENEPGTHLSLREEWE